MIYLSRLLLNPRSRQVQMEQRNPYELHRTLAQAFGTEKQMLQAARCLFRVEAARDTEALCVLVQSRTSPDWQRLSLLADYWLKPPQTKIVDLRLPAGIRLAFRLRANPTLCQEGKRRPIRNEAEQLRWLERKGNTHGFRLGLAQVTHAEIVQFRTAEDRPVTLQAVLFDGVMTVTEPDLIQRALEEGIGSAKGFGFGLLSIARKSV